MQLIGVLHFATSCTSQRPVQCMCHVPGPDTCTGHPLLQAGLDAALAQLRSYPGCVDGDPAVTENRVIVLTGELVRSVMGAEGLWHALCRQRC